LVLSFGAP